MGDTVPFSGGSLACFHDPDTIPKNCQRNFIETPVKEWLFFDRSGRLRGSGLKDIAPLIRTPDDFPLWACLPKKCVPVIRQNPLHVECTGLGGGDLGGPLPWDVCIRTGKNHDNVYGPSMATVEETRTVGKREMHLVALGMTKNCHGFLVLRYYACDSALLWDSFPIVRL